MSETKEELPTDTILEPTTADTKQFKVQLTTEGVLHQDTVIYESDFNIISRYDLYVEEVVDEIEAQLVVQYLRRDNVADAPHFLDIYFYDKSKTKEYRNFITFQKVESIQNEIDHDKGFSVLKICLDGGKDISFKNCPIEIVTWLSRFLFSL